MRRIFKIIMKATISFLQIYLMIELIIVAKAISMIGITLLVRQIIPFSIFLLLFLSPIYFSLLLYHLYRKDKRYMSSRRYIII